MRSGNSLWISVVSVKFIAGDPGTIMGWLRPTRAVGKALPQVEAVTTAVNGALARPVLSVTIRLTI